MNQSTDTSPTNDARPTGAGIAYWLLPFASLLLTLASVLHGEPLDPRHLPADTAWFVYLDADAARESAIGEKLRELWILQPNNAEAVEQARKVFGLDPTTDIHSITVYGTNYTPDAGILIYHGRVDRPRLIALLATLPGYHSESDSGSTVYTWNETDPNRRHSSAGTFVGNDMVVVAPDVQMLHSALDVLAGKSPALATDSPLTAAAPPGTILQAAAVGLAGAKSLPIQSPVIRQCESGSVAFGEHDNRLFIRGRLSTQSPETATRICSLIEGAKALGQLQAPENADLAKLLEGLRVSPHGQSVEVNWQYSSDELVKMALRFRAKKLAATQPGNSQ